MGHKEGHSRMHCTFSGIIKGTFWAEAMLKSKKMELMTLAIVRFELKVSVS